MRLDFTGKTNKNYVMVNTAIFALKDGGTVTIDRGCTEYTIKDGRFRMMWGDCYLWRFNDVNIFNTPYYPDKEAFVKLLKGATLLKLEAEDDADEDYEITDVQWSISLN